MSEPNYGQNGWNIWRGEVTHALRALEEGQARIEAALKEQSSNNSEALSETNRRIDAVEQRWTWAALSALAALVMALAAWIAKFITLGG